MQSFLRSVADCLKRQIEVKPETFQSATVYFSDIQGFTDLCSVSEPLEIVNFLNEVYYRFDSVLERYNVYKVETIGDAYVVCSGVPIPVQNHATEMAMCALHLVNISANLKVAHKPQHHFLMRIGLHCAGHIQISEQCKAVLEKDPDYILEAREPIFVKGKGTLQTYFLKGKIGFNPADSFLSLSSVSATSVRDQGKHVQPMNGGGGLKQQQQQQQHESSSLSQLPQQQQQQQSPRQLQTVRPMPQQQQQLQQQGQKETAPEQEQTPQEEVKGNQTEILLDPTALSSQEFESLMLLDSPDRKIKAPSSDDSKEGADVTEVLPNVCVD
ncbi:guanylate cyclase A/atrial natriuretic peptide receptor [Elysia marginata]|uniref:Guanylate cyclase A/atrial natriuretic peptide receptor n=1 Tax=Elysia marginata TaxID=1093978 RepID=A0AAV4G744_9GAST|nr:guanylate cyclase A/atrial natriuretic peptide receptor [Elysia marginata]